MSCIFIEIFELCAEYLRTLFYLCPAICIYNALGCCVISILCLYMWPSCQNICSRKSFQICAPRYITDAFSFVN